MCLVRVNASLAGTGHFPLSDKACRQILAELRIRYLWKSYLSLQSSSTPVIKNRARDIGTDTAFVWNLVAQKLWRINRRVSVIMYDRLYGIVGCMWTAVPKSHRIGCLNNRNVFSHSSGGLKPQNKVWEGLVSPEASSWLAVSTFLLIFAFFFFPCAPVPLLSLSASKFCWWHQLLDCIRAQPNGLILISLPL